MAPPKTPARMKAEEICAKFPDAPNLQVARLLREKHPKYFTTLENARSMVRRLRGAHGEERISEATQPRKKGFAGQLLSCPPSSADSFEPFVVEGCKRVGIISDTHIPYHSREAIESAIEHLKKQLVDVLLINGDLCDFYQVSRWEKDPEKRSFKSEIGDCKTFLKWLRQEFPKCRIVYKLGNHDERWDKYLWQRAPEIFDLPNVRLEAILETESIGVETVGDQRVVKLGKLPVLHGHELQKGISAPVNPARGAFLKTLHSVLVSHSHRTSTHVEPDMNGREIAVWSIGMLCAPNPEYNRFAKSNYGFAFVEVASDGQYDVENYRIGKDWKVRTA